MFLRECFLIPGTTDEEPSPSPSTPHFPSSLLETDSAKPLAWTENKDLVTHFANQLTGCGLGQRETYLWKVLLFAASSLVQFAHTSCFWKENQKGKNKYCKIWFACTVRIKATGVFDIISLTYMQHWRFVFGPPNLGLSRQLMHLEQSFSIKQPLQTPQRRERTPPCLYRLKIFLFFNLWAFPLPLLLCGTCSGETVHWVLSLSVRSSSSSATSWDKTNKEDG